MGSCYMLFGCGQPEREYDGSWSVLPTGSCCVLPVGVCCPSGCVARVGALPVGACFLPIGACFLPIGGYFSHWGLFCLLGRVGADLGVGA